MIKQQTQCDPQFKRDLDLLNARINLEDQMAEVSEEMETEELLNAAHQKGEIYGIGYEDGFGAGYLYHLEKERARFNSISRKYDEFNTKWGLTSVSLFREVVTYAEKSPRF